MEDVQQDLKDVQHDLNLVLDVQHEPSDWINRFEDDVIKVRQL